MGIHHSQATMRTPGLDSFWSCKPKHTFPDSNNVFLQKQGYAFIPLSKNRFEFICVCANLRPPLIFRPFRTEVHSTGFRTRGKPICSPRALACPSELATPVSGTLKPASQASRVCWHLLSASSATDLPGPTDDPALVGRQFTTHPQRRIVQGKQKYWAAMRVDERSPEPTPYRRGPAPCPVRGDKSRGKRLCDCAAALSPFRGGRC